MNRILVLGCVFIITILNTQSCPAKAGETPKVSNTPARYWEAIDAQKVQCHLCPNNCMLNSGQRGRCGVRENKKGNLITLIYGFPCAVHIDPMEKKPLFHFLPGTLALSIATAGCNLKCKFCQNYDISQSLPEEVMSFALSPEEVVKLATAQNCPSIAYTYSEPTIFYEYMLEVAKLAHKAGIKNIMHSNGYINPEPLQELTKYLDATNIDLKGFTDEYYQEVCEGTLGPILGTLKLLKKAGVWLEITNLVVPTKNDNMAEIKKMCEWIRDSLGMDVPVHFSRFWPTYKLKNLPLTPEETLEQARKIAMKVGLKYVYIGNVERGHPAENTYCPACGKIVVKRSGYSILENNIVNGKCKFCSSKIPGIWK